jgi:hypothetical protein
MAAPTLPPLLQLHVELLLLLLLLLPLACTATPVAAAEQEPEGEAGAAVAAAAGGAFEEAWEAWEQGVCSSHNSCATCIADKACGWCTGSIGNSDPGSCVDRAGKCDTILETAKCPDCHLPWIRFACEKTSYLVPFVC